MKELGHDRIDLLKIDIEGAEHFVIKSILEAGIRPDVICLEIDQPVHIKDLWGTVRRIKAAGYALVAVDSWNLTFLRRTRSTARWPAGSVTTAAAPARPRVTFGIIVLNGEPFTSTPFARSTPSPTRSSSSRARLPGPGTSPRPTATPATGRSTRCAAFKAEEDPDGKVVIVTAEDDGHPNGFWPGEKDEQSRAYARRATGDYLWQVDIDEFYRAEEIEQRPRPCSPPSRDRCDDVPPDHLLGRPRLRLRRLVPPSRRGRLPPAVPLGPGLHLRVPIVRRPSSTQTGRDLRSGDWLDGDATVAMGVHLYHYSLLFPKQVIEKCDYYATADWAKRSGAVEWANEAFLALHRPYRVHNVFAHPSWLERYDGPQPLEGIRMMEELRATDPGDAPPDG